MTEKHPGYYAPPGGLPPQTQLMTQRAVPNRNSSQHVSGTAIASATA